MDLSQMKATWTTLSPSGEDTGFGATDIPSDVFRPILDDYGIQYQMQSYKTGSGGDRMEFSFPGSSAGSRSFWRQVSDTDKNYTPKIRN